MNDFSALMNFDCGDGADAVFGIVSCYGVQHEVGRHALKFCDPDAAAGVGDPDVDFEGELFHVCSSLVSFYYFCLSFASAKVNSIFQIATTISMIFFNYFSKSNIKL